MCMGYKNIMYSLHFYANEKSHSQYLPSKLDESRKKGLASKTRKTGNWKTKDLSKAGEYIRSKYRARKKALGKHS